MIWETERIRALLRGFEFQDLFTQELGWEHHHSSLPIHVNGQDFALTCFAQKRGVQIFECSPDVRGHIPDYATRRKIDKHVTKSAHEHLIIFVDGAKKTQVWQWVLKQPGGVAAYREQAYDIRQSGQPLIEKLARITFPLSAEAGLTITGVTITLREAFDKERVTRRFYERFKAERAAFLQFLKGIPDEEMQRWYVSVMLNRLMFIYFIQKKGFLDNDTDYLRNKLAESRGRFYSAFLCPLFFEGFAKREGDRSEATNRLLGKVPYLNGGLFLRHQIEELHGDTIQIADAAFDKLFDFFEQYQWHLDERPLRNDREINPDVLGYIFEKYINQKQMGAYYTKEDITGYIARNTVIPFLFEAARQKCRIAFEGDQSVWRLLEEDPDRYIYDAVKKGVDLPLPPEIAAGVNDVSRRSQWNRPAPEEYAPPTEIWREVVARRQRYEEVWQKMVAGQVREINDLITYNLDIRQFAQDVIENCEGPELLRAFWHAIERVTVLDPTCGSGAFLFAALNVLEPLYEACLDRMQVFLEEVELSGEKHHPEKFSDFRKTMERVAAHSNRRYFVLKSTILNNLFGVDIMDEAVEICKLRLFLKLVAQVERVEFIEPLPDIDFNIRAGNTLVGFASYQDILRAITLDKSGQMKMLSAEETATMKRIEEKAQDVERLFAMFRKQQTELGVEVTASDKLALRNHLGSLEDELNLYLAKEYGIELSTATTSPAYQDWLATHKPFHWFIEFYGIIKGGGFDVVIGNPPYVEISDVVGQYAIKGLGLVGTGNLYSACVERFTHLLNVGGHSGVIIPISSISTPRMLPLMKFVIGVFSPLFLSNFAVRPGKLFVGTDMNLTIMIGEKRVTQGRPEVWATRYNRWREEFRPVLFEGLTYTSTALLDKDASVPKISLAKELSLMQKISSYPVFTRYRSTAFDSDIVYYHSGGRYFRKCLRERLSNEYKELAVEKGAGDAVIALLSSSLYYWFWIAVSDCYHVTKRDIDALHMPESLSTDGTIKHLGDLLLADLKKNAKVVNRKRADGSERDEVNFDVGKSKPIVDEIDRVLAKHYGFTDEELDFIINYDIKYRMGRDGDREEE